ncbi:cyclic peptide export ABC transporter [Pseudopelagicola sp. nBUS_19]|uniref:cyclic peptide export ABC transporter n=1 Tax=Pseudopelagicola sp. nBUS_19 TaxID=3395316 RepID=UPI003EBADFF0
MLLLRFLLNTATTRAFRVVALTTIAALSAIFLIAIVNNAAERVAFGGVIALRSMLLFTSALVVYYLALQSALMEANEAAQVQLATLTQEISRKISAANLRKIEKIGLVKIYDIVAQESNNLSQNFPLIISAGQGVITLGFCLLYVAYLSLVTFLFILGATIIALVIFVILRKQLKKELVGVHAHELALLDRVNDYIDGFSEIRLNADKNDDLQRDFESLTFDLENKVTGVGRKWVHVIQFSDAYLYLLVGGVVFLIPYLLSRDSYNVYQLSVLAVFCVGPVTAITSVAPLYERASLSLTNILKLRSDLDDVASSIQQNDVVDLSKFKKIALSNISFSYEKKVDEAFKVGPVDLEVSRGELIFMIGSNGSGKSTLAKIACGLYLPEEGTVKVDDVEIGENHQQSYRELFSSVFSDFHLFTSPYGYENADSNRVSQLISYMGIEDKVHFENGRFSTLQLSLGQRKRLALIAALLEDKPVLVLDEWGADQDPEFRDRFYTEILPELKAKGQTIIVLTHDDRYWHLSDRIIAVDFGKIIDGPNTSSVTGGFRAPD